MQTVEEIGKLQVVLESLEGTIALVPTMGALHSAHISLIELAKEHADHVIVSIFVNPTQFNKQSDLEKYPRNLEADLEKLKSSSTSLVFAPDPTDIYQNNCQTNVTSGDLGKRLEGEFRPGHFDGVCTIISILFNLIRPDYAVFGEKDFQQLRVIQQMTRDLHFPVEIIGAPLMRHDSGLAISSRNELLSIEQKEIAANIFKSLEQANLAYQQGEVSAEKIVTGVKKFLEYFPEITPEYITITDEDSLSLSDEIISSKKRLLPSSTRSSKTTKTPLNPPYISVFPPNSRIFIAADVGGVRLIDNLRLGGV